MTYGGFKDLTGSNKVLRDKAFNFAKSPKHDGYQALVVPLKDKKGITINNAIHTILDESEGCKLNKIWKEKGGELYNQSIKPWLQDNNKEYAMKNTQ